MDKNISDNDRIVIGVREWAVVETLKNLAPFATIDAREIKENADKVVGYAKRLEKYVLEGFKG